MTEEHLGTTRDEISDQMGDVIADAGRLCLGVQLQKAAEIRRWGQSVAERAVRLADSLDEEKAEQQLPMGCGDDGE